MHDCVVCVPVEAVLAILLVVPLHHQQHQQHHPHHHPPRPHPITFTTTISSSSMCLFLHKGCVWWEGQPSLVVWAKFAMLFDTKQRFCFMQSHENVTCISPVVLRLEKKTSLQHIANVAIRTEIFTKASEAKKAPACHSCRTHSEWQTQPATKPLGQKTESRALEDLGVVPLRQFLCHVNWLKPSETNYMASCCASHECRFAFIGGLTYSQNFDNCLDPCKTKWKDISETLQRGQNATAVEADPE